MSDSQSRTAMAGGGIRLWTRPTIDLSSTSLLSSVKRRRFEMLAVITRKFEEFFLPSWSWRIAGAPLVKHAENILAVHLAIHIDVSGRRLELTVVGDDD